MCELARNSVLQSGWEMQVKKHWLGNKWYLPGVAGNDIDKVSITGHQNCDIGILLIAMLQTNVPNIRLGYRHAALLEKL